MKSYDICLSVSGLLHLVWQSLGPSMLLQTVEYYDMCSWVIFHCIYVPHFLSLFIWNSPALKIAVLSQLVPCLLIIFSSSYSFFHLNLSAYKAYSFISQFLTHPAQHCLELLLPVHTSPTSFFHSLSKHVLSTYYTLDARLHPWE